MDRKQIETRLIERAQSDESFRQRLVSDPAATISSELGITLPSRLKLQVLEETDTNLYLVLPASQVKTLNEAELAAVVGGAQQAETQGSFFSKLVEGDAGAGDVSNKANQSQA